eukprot:2535092-Rhodomonas_salina.4
MVLSLCRSRCSSARDESRSDACGEKTLSYTRTLSSGSEEEEEEEERERGVKVTGRLRDRMGNVSRRGKMAPRSPGTSGTCHANAETADGAAAAIRIDIKNIEVALIASIRWQKERFTKCSTPSTPPPKPAPDCGFREICQFYCMYGQFIDSQRAGGATGGNWGRASAAPPI